MIQSRKRVTLNRRSSSLVLDHQAMMLKQEPSDYTRQLVASALSLPDSVKIETKQPTLPPSPPTEIDDKNKIVLPRFLKSSLRSPRSASAPCSPTTGLKSVHFNKTNLEDVCLFRKAQTPLAISQKHIFWADNSDTEEDDEYDEDDEDNEPLTTTTQKSLVCANWPTRLSDIIDRKNKIIRVDKATIHLQGNDLIAGKISVRNLDYHKTVTIRYTFDFWETVYNVQANFYEGHKVNDVFHFKIHTPASASTLYFAVHYKVGSREYWDNNDGRNYEIKIVSQQIKKKNKSFSLDLEDDDMIVMAAAAAVSASTDKKPIQTTTTTVVSTTSTSTTTSSLSSTSEKEGPLKTRYDFGQSISRAKNQPSTTISHNNNTTHNMHIPLPSPSSSIHKSIPIPIAPRRSKSSSSPTGLSCHSPLASSPSFMDLNSQSYMDLVNKYCFYSTSPSRSPMSING